MTYTLQKNSITWESMPGLQLSSWNTEITVKIRNN
jgi:hypothetical protein